MTNPHLRHVAHSLSDLDDAALEREFLALSADERWLLLFAVMRENRRRIDDMSHDIDRMRPLWVRAIERGMWAIGGAIAGWYSTDGLPRP